jgi:hypothetical protein
MFNKQYVTKLIGAFIFVFGLFFLLLAITNIFNDVEFIKQYNSCLTIADYTPEILDTCKTNVSNGLNIVIRANQLELSTGQYLRIFFWQIIQILFAVILIIVGDYIYLSKKKEEVPQRKPIFVKKIVKKKRR